MKTLLIIAVIVLLFVALVALRNTLRRRKRNTLATSLENIQNNSTYQMLQALQNTMGVHATQQGKVPGAYGEFGHDATNPIPTKGIPGQIAYLAKLRTENGVTVEYERKGHTRAENIKHPIDMYEIRENGEYVCMLHLCPYYKENSAIAPKGFEVISINELFGE